MGSCDLRVPQVGVHAIFMSWADQHIDLRTAHYAAISLHPLTLQTEEFSVKPGDLIVNSLVGLSALVHNGSNLGFFKRRGAANW